VTTPFAIDARVVDGAGGIVVVVIDDVDGVVLLSVVGLLVAGLEPEHAAPMAIDAATSATTHRKSVSGHSRA
jgi:hypothetical protein